MGQSIQEWTKQNLWKTTLKNLKGYGRLSSTNFAWSILEYFVPYFLLIIQSHRTIIYEMQSKPLSQVLVYIAIYCIFEITCYN